MSRSENFKIFIVDDDPFHLNLVEQIIHNQNQTDTTLFENGLECLNQIHLRPDIVFLDHCMDTYNGYEVLRKIKRYDPNIFTIMISAQEDMQTAIDVLKNGAFDYIQKGANLEEQLKNVLAKITTVKEIIRSRKPSIIKSIFQYL
jgi:DNA-binding NtrC family response regulator